MRARGADRQAAIRTEVILQLERELLEEGAVVAGGLEPALREVLGDVVGGLVVALLTGAAALELIAGEVAEVLDVLGRREESLILRVLVFGVAGPHGGGDE